LLLAIGLLVAQQFGFALDPQRPQLGAMAAVTLLMAVWWLTEAVPLAATALVPLVAFPLCNIMPSSQVAAQYGNKLIFLFLGGFLIALAVERSGLHRRIALLIVKTIGDSPRRVVLGFMLATAGLSMWLSNTATTVMMLPIALSILAQAEAHGDGSRNRRMSVALLLGIAYSASIGGIGTLIGTPTNVAFSAFWSQWIETHPDASPITFFHWMTMALPFVLVMLLATWAMLVWVICPVGSKQFLGGKSVAADELAKLGPMTPAQWRMLTIFLTTALLWILRNPVDGWGWAQWLVNGNVIPNVKTVGDETVAMMMALVCFAVPSGGHSAGKPTGRLLDWPTALRVPWGILLLFGGGLALAAGMGASGLDQYLGGQLKLLLENLSETWQIAATASGMTILTELTSNVASLQMILPVLGGAADQLGVNPLTLMIPATLAASCAFMLPVATPPNAIVFGSGHLKISDMVKAGLWLNGLGTVLIVIAVCFMRWIGHL
jgi:sodium-dependent dicarboxylate transporter 2/3/5